MLDPDGNAQLRRVPGEGGIGHGIDNGVSSRLVHLEVFDNAHRRTRFGERAIPGDGREEQTFWIDQCLCDRSGLGGRDDSASRLRRTGE